VRMQFFPSHPSFPNPDRLHPSSHIISYPLLSSADFPQLILDIERLELGIAAGLQDRVIQTHGGVVHMDFSRLKEEGRGVYTAMDPHLLPELYLAYNADAGALHFTALHFTSQHTIHMT
jgi:hypothetical protein